MRFLSVVILTCFMIMHVHAFAGGMESLRQTSKAFATVAQKVSPSVVYIQVESTQKIGGADFSSPFDDEVFKRFFGNRFPGFTRPQQPRERRSVGQGSGFVFSLDKGIFSDKAYILTNNHVVEGADKIRVKFQSGQELFAKIKGADPKSDIAVLEIDDPGVPNLVLGDSGELEVGEWVMAFGNPFGLNHTLTVGVVSSKGRTSLGISDYEDFIQTDAAINPGNSGGPLVNLDGEVVGINTAIFSRSGGYMGVGFAIPVNMAKNIALQLLDDGEVRRGYLGVVIQNLTPELADSLDIKVSKGILVSQVSEDSPAGRAGLKQGDLVVRYEGESVSDVGAFRNRVSLTPPGTRAMLDVVRGGRKIQIEAIIGELDEARLAGERTESTTELGLTVQTLTPELGRQLGARMQKGVVVTEVKSGSIAAMAGIKVGTVISQVNRKDVATAEEFGQQVEKSTRDKQVLLLISNGGVTRFVVLRW
ncbi:MAG: DegQ family serine endoprotease [Candidatus Thiodiazotropha sp. 'RUGA']|nr:DegQ family serine endoprotease [Candidatus Thiodiazotropha sp. 'RUGA']